MSVTDSSQGGGGVFVHAWAHNLQIANDRVYNNIGAHLSGGINIGQESRRMPRMLAGNGGRIRDPGSCENSAITGLQLPYCFDLHVNVHNNMVTANTSIGDELFSGTPAGAGGVSFCTGADYYEFNYNWLCGNMSTGDGGGFAHVGFIKNGDIEHNWILFNQSTNPTIATNGGGLIVMGAAPDGLTATGVECGSTVADLDCPPGVPDGTGPGLKINANLILGNSAASGSGGGVRFQSVNGTDISLIPNQPQLWNSVMLTNNIVVNNVAGWDGGGISLQDSLNIDIINNTIASNDTTASAGVLFTTIGAPEASAPGATKPTPGNGTPTAPQPAGHVCQAQNSEFRLDFRHGEPCGQPLVTCTRRANASELCAVLQPVSRQRSVLAEPRVLYRSRFPERGVPAEHRRRCTTPHSAAAAWRNPTGRRSAASLVRPRVRRPTGPARPSRAGPAPA